MKFEDTRVKFLRKAWMITILLILLGLMLTNLVSANSIDEELLWVTICHIPPEHPEDAQTLVVYWSAFDKYLCHYNCILGPCP